MDAGEGSILGGCRPASKNYGATELSEARVASAHVSDASDLFWGCCITQVPRGEVQYDVLVEEMSHEPLGFVSGSFRGSQLNWPTMDKEGYAIVVAIKRLDYLMWAGEKIFCVHRNLAYTFSPHSCDTVVTKATTQYLEH